MSTPNYAVMTGWLTASIQHAIAELRAGVPSHKVADDLAEHLAAAEQRGLDQATVDQVYRAIGPAPGVYLAAGDVVRLLGRDKPVDELVHATRQLLTERGAA